MCRAYRASPPQNYYFDNAEGSTLSVLNDSGALQSRNEYDGYGITYPEVAGAQSDFRFVGSKGYVTDDDTGLDMLGHRYYIPQLGRFLTQGVCPKLSGKLVGAC